MKITFVYNIKSFIFRLGILILAFNNYLFTSKIIQKNGKFIDKLGRSRIFHGVNIVYKLPPYIPIDGEFEPLLGFNNDDVSYLKKFGFNLVRLGVMWEAIEIASGVYNQELLEKYFQLVNLLGQNGIYTIIDAHQDVLSRKTCGEGIPVFYIENTPHEKECTGSLLKYILYFLGICKPMKDYNYRNDENGLPNIEDCKTKMFALYHTAPEITSLYQKLYDNESGLLDKFINFWKVVTNKFKGNKFVLGYDLWNEPFPGNMYDNPFESLYPGNPDNKQLLPFYRKIDQSLREIDNDYILMYENTPFPDFLPVLSFQFRGLFNDIPLSAEYLDKQMFNYHSYCCSTGFSICEEGEPPLDKEEICRVHHYENVAQANKYADKFKIGTIITEFGACFNTQACFNEISSLADAADEYLNSWAYWQYKPFKDFTTTCKDDKEGLFEKDGSLQEYKIKALTRTYVQASQGNLINMKFDKETKVFSIKFILNTKISEPTIIYYNKSLNYQKGLKILTSLPDAMIEHAEENYVKIFYKDESYSIDGEEVTIILSPLETDINIDKYKKNFLSRDFTEHKVDL